MTSRVGSRNLYQENKGFEEVQRMLELVKASKPNTMVPQPRPEAILFRTDRKPLRRPLSGVDDAATSLLHDLRNPLATICGCADLLMDASLDQWQTRRLASNLHAAAGRMKKIFTEFASTQVRAETAENCNLRAIIANACENAGVTDHGTVVLHMDVPLRIELPMTRTRMESVFLNLIVNAIEAMPHGGSLRIAATEEHNRVVIVIEDTGPGIPTEIRSVLFQPFTTARKKDGLGLGLMLSRRTVEDHGGELRVESAAGGRFVISLPLCLSAAGNGAG
jgi:signal transduction histidine kinase